MIQTDGEHRTDKKEGHEKILVNLTSIDYIVLAAMHYTDLKTMIKIHPVELVVSCEKFFDCKLMKKMDRNPSLKLEIKIQNWLNSVEYLQYTKNINKLLTLEEKQKIRKIYVKLGLKPHDLSELTNNGVDFLEKKKSELNQHWNILVEYNKSKDIIYLKESMDKFANSIPIMFTMGIANGTQFVEMFKTMDIGMYGYMSANPEINPIFLDYLNNPNGIP
jgi:hypothetical protein